MKAGEGALIEGAQNHDALGASCSRRTGIMLRAKLGAPGVKREGRARLF
jgi:hypothetical protein